MGFELSVAAVEEGVGNRNDVLLSANMVACPLSSLVRSNRGVGVSRSE